jgi:hypothetical protein
MRPVITGKTSRLGHLVHFSRPLGNMANVRGHATHYIGFTPDDGSGAGLSERVAEHLAGDGARITKAALAQGIEIELVACWRAPLAFEKQLKRRKEAPRLCPICCKARGQKVRNVIAAEQLVLPLFESEAEVEPWPEGFEFPAPTILKRSWAEIDAEIQARSNGVALSGRDDWDEGLL